jgi:hypothetical protein
LSYLIDIAQQVEELGAESVEPLMKAIELFIPKRAKSQHSEGMKEVPLFFYLPESFSTWLGKHMSDQSGTRSWG